MTLYTANDPKKVRNPRNFFEEIFHLRAKNLYLGLFTYFKLYDKFLAL